MTASPGATKPIERLGTHNSASSLSSCGSTLSKSLPGLHCLTDLHQLAGNPAIERRCHRLTAARVYLQLLLRQLRQAMPVIRIGHQTLPGELGQGTCSSCAIARALAAAIRCIP